MNINYGVFFCPIEGNTQQVIYSKDVLINCLQIIFDFRINQEYFKGLSLL